MMTRTVFAKDVVRRCWQQTVSAMVEKQHKFTLKHFPGVFVCVCMALRVCKPDNNMLVASAASARRGHRRNQQG